MIKKMTISFQKIKVDVPEGYEIDQDNSSFDHIVFKKRRRLTVGEVFKYVKDKHDCKYVDLLGNIRMNARIEAYFILCCVADYYNQGWKPNWKDDTEEKWFINKDYFNVYNSSYKVDKLYKDQNCDIYFKRADDAQAVIENPEFRQYLEWLIP